MAKSKAKSGTERQDELRERYRAEGLKWTSVWTHEDDRAEVREFAASRPKTKRAMDRAKAKAK